MASLPTSCRRTIYFTAALPHQVYPKSISPSNLNGERYHQRGATNLTVCSAAKSNRFSLNSVRQFSSSRFGNDLLQSDQGGMKSKRVCLSKVKALPDWPLMVVLLEHLEGQRDMITHKSIWHLSDQAIKNVYLFYIMFTCWGCCVFGSTKDPFYDSEYYRKDGGDGSGHWVYEKQEQIEETSRAELWKEELLEEIEQKVGGLRELEEAKEEELVTK